MDIYQQNIDLIEQDYDSKIEGLKATQRATESVEKQEKIQKRIDTLLGKREADLEALGESRRQGFQMLLDTRGDTPDSIEAFNRGVKRTTLARFADDDPFKEVAKKTLDNLAKLSDKTAEDTEFKTSLQIAFANDDIGLTAVNSILELADDPNLDIKANFTSIYKARGAADSGVLMGLLEKAGIEGEELDTQLNYFASIETDKEFDEKVIALGDIASAEKNFKININVYTNDEKDTQNIDFPPVIC
jgi:hypothetical protein